MTSAMISIVLVFLFPLLLLIDSLLSIDYAIIINCLVIFVNYYFIDLAILFWYYTYKRSDNNGNRRTYKKIASG